MMYIISVCVKLNGYKRFDVFVALCKAFQLFMFSNVHVCGVTVSMDIRDTNMQVQFHGILWSQVIECLSSNSNCLRI